jgi:hypothetical protein
MIIRSLALAMAPPRPLNLVGSLHHKLLDIALRFGELLKKEVQFVGVEGNSAFLSDNTQLLKNLGDPPTPIELVMQWTANWITSGGQILNKPTHFEVKDGGY